MVYRSVVVDGVDMILTWAPFVIRLSYHRPSLPPPAGRVRCKTVNSRDKTLVQG